MTRKVTLAIFDTDLKATIGKYELSDDGTKIKVKSGGEAHWMPTFDNDSFIEFPKKRWEIWKPDWTKIYFVKKKGSKCVNFTTDPADVTGPDPEQLSEATGAVMLSKLGKQEQETPLISYATLVIGVIILLRLFGVF